MSAPVARINYLASNGRVAEELTFDNEEKFLNRLKEDNYYGVPLTITLFADKDGNVISRNFVKKLDPLPQGINIERIC